MSEQATELDPSAKTAELQGSTIPLRWKPTPSEPIPVVRCTQIKRNGSRCKRWSYRGATKCVTHLDNNGKLKNVREHADAIVEAARLRMLDNTDLAIDTLEKLMEPGTSEGIRLKSATEILDRAGIRGGFDLNVEVTHNENPADEIASRLTKLAEGAATVKRMRAEVEHDHEDPSDVVDAEIIPEEDDGQETLF